MNEHSPDNPFQLGERYQNRKGFFTVMAFFGDKMLIRWDTGEEAVDTISSQARILQNLEREQASLQIGQPSAINEPNRISSYDISYAESVCCARCGHYTNHPEYYEGKPYGPDCVTYVRGVYRPTREFVIASSYYEPSAKESQDSWIKTAVEVVIAVGGLALLLLTSKSSKK